MNPEISNISITQSAIDMDVLSSLWEMLGNDNAIFTKIIQSYLAECPQIVEDISTAVENKDLQMLEQMAHKLKSSSASIGAVNLGNLCSNMEEMGEEGNLENSLETLNQLTQEYTEVEITLQEIINKLGEK